MSTGGYKTRIKFRAVINGEEESIKDYPRKKPSETRHAINQESIIRISPAHEARPSSSVQFHLACGWSECHQLPRKRPSPPPRVTD